MLLFMDAKETVDIQSRDDMMIGYKDLEKMFSKMSKVMKKAMEMKRIIMCLFLG